MDYLDDFEDDAYADVDAEDLDYDYQPERDAFYDFED